MRHCFGRRYRDIAERFAKRLLPSRHYPRLRDGELDVVYRTR